MKTQDQHPELTVTHLRNLVHYLERHPSQPLDTFLCTFAREDLSPDLWWMFCGRHCTSIELVRRVVIQPYFRAALGADPFPEIHHQIKPEKVLDILSNAINRVVLQHQDAARFLHRRCTARNAEFYFATPVHELNVRNALMFAQVLFATPGRGEDLQSKIPVPLAKSLGIKRHSTPELLLMVDMLSLAALGLARKESGMNEMWKCYDRVEVLKDTGAIAERHFQRALLNTEVTWLVPYISEEGRLQKSYWHGLLFNLEELVPEARVKEIYEGLDEKRFREAIVEHHRGVDGEVAKELEEEIRREPGKCEGVRVRCVGNWLVWRGREEEKEGEVWGGWGDVNI